MKFRTVGFGWGNLQMVGINNKSFFNAFFLAAFLLIICVFSNAKSNKNETNTEQSNNLNYKNLDYNNNYSEIKNEIDHLHPKYEWQVAEINNYNAPVLSKFVNKYLEKFCAKSNIQAPPVCLYYNPKDYENYNFYWDGKNILIGNKIVDILFNNKNFEKYFAALLAHEFAHFRLNHKPCDLSSQEEEADKFAFTLIDNPADLLFAHLFDSLAFIMAQAFTEYIPDENKLNALTSQTIGIFINLAPDFGSFAQCSCWMSFYHLFYVAFIKTKFNTNILANEFALNLANVSKSYLKLDMDYLKIWIPRFIEFLSHPLLRETHPSPKQLSVWCQKIMANK